MSYSNEGGYPPCAFLGPQHRRTALQLVGVKMTTMSLMVPPLYVIYGVHDDQNVVIVQRVIQI